MIETSELDQLLNIRNVILYCHPYVLASNIEKTCDKSIGGITASQIMLIYLADEEVVYGLQYWLQRIKNG